MARIACLLSPRFHKYQEVPNAATSIASRERTASVIRVTAHPVRSFIHRATDPKAAAKGMYVIRDFDPDRPRHGYVVAQGSSSTVNLLSVLPRLEQEGLNVKVISTISQALCHRQPEEYRNSVFPPEARYDLMIVSTGTRRVWPLQDPGPLTDEYSLVSDWHDEWLTGGTEADVIAEARLDPESIFQGVRRFALDHDSRISRQTAHLAGLK